MNTKATETILLFPDWYTACVPLEKQQSTHGDSERKVPGPGLISDLGTFDTTRGILFNYRNALHS